MQRAFGLDIPQTLEDICDPTRLALVVYDMQVGIVKQIENGQQITDRVVQVLEAARKARVRVFFTRHMSLPKELMGVSQFRMAMAWQRVNSANEVNPWFLRDAPGFHLISEMKPLPSEAIFDKITMSAFEGTPLNIALRDCGIDAFAIVGIATEIAIEPTVRHPLILVTSLWWLKTPAVSVIAMRQSVHLRASNSQAMLCLQTSKRSAPSFGAYNRNRRWSGRDRRGASRRARSQMYVGTCLSVTRKHRDRISAVHREHAATLVSALCFHPRATPIAFRERGRHPQRVQQQTQAKNCPIALASHRAQPSPKVYPCVRSS